MQLVSLRRCVHSGVEAAESATTDTVEDCVEQRVLVWHEVRDR